MHLFVKQRRIRDFENNKSFQTYDMLYYKVLSAATTRAYTLNVTGWVDSTTHRPNNEMLLSSSLTVLIGLDWKVADFL